MAITLSTASTIIPIPCILATEDACNSSSIVPQRVALPSFCTNSPRSHFTRRVLGVTQQEPGRTMTHKVIRVIATPILRGIQLVIFNSSGKA